MAAADRASRRIKARQQRGALAARNDLAGLGRRQHGPGDRPPGGRRRGHRPGYESPVQRHRAGLPGPRIDGQPARGNPRIRHWAAGHGVQLCFTPTYASWANPIEAHFGVLKQFAMAQVEPPEPSRADPATARVPALAQRPREGPGGPGGPAPGTRPGPPREGTPLGPPRQGAFEQHRQPIRSPHRALERHRKKTWRAAGKQLIQDLPASRSRRVIRGPVSPWIYAAGGVGSPSEEHQAVGPVEECCTVYVVADLQLTQARRAQCLNARGIQGAGVLVSAMEASMVALQRAPCGACTPSSSKRCTSSD